MKFIKTDIPEVIIIEPHVWEDERGYFFESFRNDLFEKAVRKINFIQDNESKSKYGTLRGLHYQVTPFEQSKLVRVIKGSVLDVAVDIRKDSQTFGQYVSVILSSTNKRQLFIPQGFAHGYITLSKTAIFMYKVDNIYSPNHEYGIKYNDVHLGINWMLEESNIVVSEKDAKNHDFSDLKKFKII